MSKILRNNAINWGNCCCKRERQSGIGKVAEEAEMGAGLMKEKPPMSILGGVSVEVAMERMLQSNKMQKCEKHEGKIVYKSPEIELKD